MGGEATQRLCPGRFGRMNRTLPGRSGNEPTAGRCAARSDGGNTAADMAERAPANTPMRFRDAELHDLGALVDLVESAYRGERSRSGWTSEADLIGGQRIDVAMMSAALRDPGSRILVVELDDQPVGCCELRRADRGDAASLGMFAVDPTRQDRGLGRRILDAAEQIVAREWNIDRLRLTVVEQRAELISWYERRGYEHTGATEPFPYGDRRFGVPRRDDLVFVVLEKRLGRAAERS